jgi:hypothetical protein
VSPSTRDVSCNSLPRANVHRLPRLLIYHRDVRRCCILPQISPRKCDQGCRSAARCESLKGCFEELEVWESLAMRAEGSDPLLIRPPCSLKTGAGLVGAAGNLLPWIPSCRDRHREFVFGIMIPEIVASNPILLIFLARLKTLMLFSHTSRSMIYL